MLQCIFQQTKKATKQTIVYLRKAAGNHTSFQHAKQQQASVLSPYQAWLYQLYLSSNYNVNIKFELKSSN